MSKVYTPYDSGNGLSLEDRAAQIRNLSVIGLAATASAYNVRDVQRCFVSLFEVIGRLADEIEDEVNP